MRHRFLSDTSWLVVQSRWLFALPAVEFTECVKFCIFELFGTYGLCAMAAKHGGSYAVRHQAYPS